jgi:NRPS condensation-like uncharacterized protein
MMTGLRMLRLLVTSYWELIRRQKYEAMTTAFGARDMKRLNRVFDVIGFFILITAFLLENKGRKEKWQLLLPPRLSQRELRF